MKRVGKEYGAERGCCAEYGAQCVLCVIQYVIHKTHSKGGAGFGSVSERMADREGANHTAKGKTPGALALAAWLLLQMAIDG